MAKISEIMLLQQPEQPALAIAVQTNMKGMSQAIGENFVRIDSLFKKQGEVTTDIPFVEYPDFESLTEDRIEMIIGLKSSKPLQGDEKIQSVIMLPGYTHNIINLSDTEDLVTVMYCNEIFNPDKPDTYFEEVEK